MRVAAQVGLPALYAARLGGPHEVRLAERLVAHAAGLGVPAVVREAPQAVERAVVLEEQGAKAAAAWAEPAVPDARQVVRAAMARDAAVALWKARADEALPLAVRHAVAAQPAPR